MKRPVLRPRLLPPALEYRWTRLFVLSGLIWTFAAAVTSFVRPDHVVALGFAAVASVLFALGFRGRAEHLEKLTLALIADRENARRLEVIGLATAGFAHELKNALTVMKGFAELAARADPAVAKERIAEVNAQADRLVADLQHFLALARPEQAEEQRPLGVVLTETAHLLAPLAQLRGITLDSKLPDGWTRTVHDPALRRALLNLGLNALQAARSSVRIEAFADGNDLVIRVEDDGPGVEPAMRDLLFTSFASGRADGTGLGLVQVREAVAGENGVVSHEPNIPAGARFVVRIPATLETHTSAPRSV